MKITKAQLLTALLKGMRRAEFARAAAVTARPRAPDGAHAHCGSLQDPDALLSLFGLDQEQIQQLGLVGVEELGETVCHAWAINAGEVERVRQWFVTPRVEFVGRRCSELIRLGRIGPVLTMAREQALLTP
ncbi:hypothetical protein [Xanthomonas maliensis]|uniref:hypothetical protein n=1 Tax=Xanthomonas maliensis TaxID=1321368 RepID=UPI0003A506BA|nr:hypothetical protein [Xanthomonas maliensis]KAB7764720.1 hypothetical protein CKY51_16970 [Xanthomonas maliensis]